MFDELQKLVPVDWDVGLVMVCGLLFVLVMGLWDPRSLIPMSLLCYAASLLNSEIIPLASVDLRAPALVLAVLFAVFRQRLPRFPSLRQGVYPAIWAYLLIGFLGMVVTTDMGAGTDTIVTVFLVVAITWLIGGAASEEEVRGSIRIMSGVILFGSLLAVLVVPDQAIEGDRWRGIVENANGLGMMAGIFLVTARSPGATRLSLPFSVLALLGSASRASAFGAGLVVGPMLFKERSQMLRRTAAVLAIAAALPLLNAVFFASSDTAQASGDSALTRTQNSRADFWEEGIEIVRAHPVTGTGLGTRPELIASSILGPMTELGYAALVPLWMVVAAGIARVRYPAQRLRPLYFFLLVNAVFEGWLFAGGSVYFLVFILAAHPLTVSFVPDAAVEPADVDEPRARPRAMVRPGTV